MARCGTTWHTVAQPSAFGSPVFQGSLLARHLLRHSEPMNRLLPLVDRSALRYLLAASLVLGLTASVRSARACEQDEDCGFGFRCTHDTAHSTDGATSMGSGGSSSTVCDNDVCEFDETFETCPADCTEVTACQPAECEHDRDCAEGYECEIAGTATDSSSDGGSIIEYSYECRPALVTCRRDADCAGGEYCQFSSPTGSSSAANTDAGDDTTSPGSGGTSSEDVDDGAGTDVGGGGTGATGGVGGEQGYCALDWDGSAGAAGADGADDGEGSGGPSGDNIGGSGPTGNVSGSGVDGGGGLSSGGTASDDGGEAQDSGNDGHASGGTANDDGDGDGGKPDEPETDGETNDGQATGGKPGDSPGSSGGGGGKPATGSKGPAADGGDDRGGRWSCAVGEHSGTRGDVGALAMLGTLALGWLQRRRRMV